MSKAKSQVVPSGMPAEVETVRARLDRSVEHFEAFRNVWEEHLSLGPHQIKIEVDPAGRGRVTLVRQREPPLELSIHLGEFLYQLRATLDNALYAVAIIDSGLNPPPGATSLEWPICDSEEAWRSARKRRLSNLSGDIQEALYAIQPFQAEFSSWNCLRILNQMARLDRHRAIHFITAYAASGKFWYDPEFISDVEPFEGPVAPDGTLVRFTWRGQGEVSSDHIDGDFEFEVEVAGVEEGPVPSGEGRGRPWGSLENRLRALHKAVAEYADGLIAIARAGVESREGPE